MQTENISHHEILSVDDGVITVMYRPDSDSSPEPTKLNPLGFRRLVDPAPGNTLSDGPTLGWVPDLVAALDLSAGTKVVIQDDCISGEGIGVWTMADRFEAALKVTFLRAVTMDGEGEAKRTKAHTLEQILDATIDGGEKPEFQFDTPLSPGQYALEVFVRDDESTSTEEGGTWRAALESDLAPSSRIGDPVDA